MPRFDTGVVSRIIEQRDGVIRALVKVGGEERAATAFTNVTGSISVGDRVVVNTTGIDLELGTGGQDFVLWNLQTESIGKMSGGHILKLRYTPWQIDTMTAEAPESPHHEKLATEPGLGGMPVIACGLHSQISPVAAVMRALEPTMRIAYLMTDGAALPIKHSDLVAELVSKKLIDATITCGHAFGGQLEAVNVFSGLEAAAKVVSADVVVVAMGPGVVGTATPVGHTEMEQGQVLNAAFALGGRPIAPLRISFTDRRERHQILSHHSIAALRYAVIAPAMVAVPVLQPERFEAVLSIMKSEHIADRHQIHVVDSSQTLEAMKQFGLETKTMGRGIDDDPEFFLAAGAAGILAAQLIGDRR